MDTNYDAYYKITLERIVDILQNPKSIKTIFDLNEHACGKQVYFINKYSLEIPLWLRECIYECTVIFPYFSTVIFNELIESIKNRKFDGNDIPSDYEIIPEDWIECYEDGYPICCYRYKYAYDDYLSFYNDFLNSLSKKELINYFKQIQLME